MGRKDDENDFEYPGFRARRTIGFDENAESRFGQYRIRVSGI